VWETITGEKLLKLAGHSKFIHAIAVLHDVTRFYTGSEDKTLRGKSFLQIVRVFWLCKVNFLDAHE
jgi:hypothetical protein